jgi:hypothetical protein
MSSSQLSLNLPCLLFVSSQVIEFDLAQSLLSSQHIDQRLGSTSRFFRRTDHRHGKEGSRQGSGIRDLTAYMISAIRKQTSFC